LVVFGALNLVLAFVKQTNTNKIGTVCTIKKTTSHKTKQTKAKKQKTKNTMKQKQTTSPTSQDSKKTFPTRFNETEIPNLYFFNTF